MEEIIDLIRRKDPEKALKEVGAALKALFSMVDQDTRGRFLLDLAGESQGDKVSSLVHL